MANRDLHLTRNIGIMAQVLQDQLDRYSGTR